MKRYARICSFLILGLVVNSAWAQDIETAEQLFTKVSNRFNDVKDYEANLTVKAGKQAPMVGKLLFKSPNLLKIDFSQPAGNVIHYNGEFLTIYVKALNAAYRNSASPDAAMSAVSGVGLRMMGTRYSKAYKNPKGEPEALSDTEPEQVIKLVLTRKSAAEGYTSITLSINPQTYMIRRMEGIDLSNNLIVYSFESVVINQGLTATKFDYDSPPSANLYNNFLYTSSNN